MNFIKTKDAATAKELQDSGVQLINYDKASGVWTFSNAGTFNFEKINNKAVLTNQLTF